MDKSLRDTLAEGDREESLIALRDHLAELLEKASPRDASPLSRQITAIVEKLAEMKKPERSRVDELASKRATRRSKSQAS